jgi:hypothetical protein
MDWVFYVIDHMLALLGFLGIHQPKKESKQGRLGFYDLLWKRCRVSENHSSTARVYASIVILLIRF